MASKADTSGDWILKLKKNIYRFKDTGRTWHLHLKEGLLKKGFSTSQIDPCVFYRRDLVLILYVDDMICMCLTDDPIDAFLAEMQGSGFSLTDQGDVNEYLGIKVKRSKDGKVLNLTQPHLIDKIITSAGLQGNSKTSDTPAQDILHKMKESQYCTEGLDFRSLIGQMNYLAATTQPDIAFAVHQCAQFSADPRKPHLTKVSY